MKNFQFLSIILIFLLSSCAFTGTLWDATIDRDEMVKDMLINEEGDEVLILAKKYDYFLGDDKKMIKQLFLSQTNLEADIDAITAKGDGVEARIILQANIKNLSQKQIEFLQYMGAKKRDNDKILKIYDPDLIGLRFASGSKSTKGFTSTGFIKNEQKTAIFEQNTPIQTTGKIILTPFTLAADILLIPITIPLFIYQQIKESQI